MPGLALREFECIFCGRQFTLLSQDFILPWTLICDECLAGVWELEEDALAEYAAAARRAEEPGGARGSTPHTYESEIVAHVRSLRGRWATAREAIRERTLEREAFGRVRDGAAR